MCRQVGEDADHQQRKVIAGLQPEVKKFVISQNPQTLDEIEQSAKVAEALEDVMNRDLLTQAMTMVDVDEEKT